MESVTRLALLSDVHGNTVALDAVLADLDSLDAIDDVWALGDLVAIGPDPVGVLDRLTSLRSCRFLAGNTERYTLTGERPLPDAKTSADRPHLPGLIAGFAWTAGRLHDAGWLDWLGQLPQRLHGQISGGQRPRRSPCHPRSGRRGRHPPRTER